MIKPDKRILSLLLIILFSFSVYSQIIGKRTPYNIPLIKLNVLIDKDKSGFKRIRIPITGKKEYAIITHFNDLHIKVTRQGEEKTVYAETPGSRFLLTAFEAQQLDRVIRAFIETLETFERDLQKQRWDKCLYLDCFFPRFLKAFYYLSCTAMSSYNALPGEANIPDDLFDISLSSEKSDERIGKWQEQRDTVIKLRIATRELVYHFKNWKKKQLSSYRRNPKIEYSENLKEAYCLFVKIYFNL